MVMHIMASDDRSYVVLDESGRAIGRVTESRFPLERVAPSDTVFLDRGSMAADGTRGVPRGARLEVGRAASAPLVPPAA